MMSAMAQCKKPGCKEEARRLYCSVKCKKDHHNMRRPKKGATKVECVACGKKFVVSRAHAKTCSDACRNKLHHARKVWVKAKKAVVPRTGLEIRFDEDGQPILNTPKLPPVQPKHPKLKFVKAKAKKKKPVVSRRKVS